MNNLQIIKGDKTIIIQINENTDINKLIKIKNNAEILKINTNNCTFLPNDINKYIDF